MATGRILVVEDDPAIRGHLTRILSSAGYHPAPVVTAAEAVTAFTTALATGERFGLVLLDLGVPDRDGIEVCQELIAADPAAKVLILTARADEIDVVMGLAAPK